MRWTPNWRARKAEERVKVAISRLRGEGDIWSGKEGMVFNCCTLIWRGVGGTVSMEMDEEKGGGHGELDGWIGME